MKMQNKLFLTATLLTTFSSYAKDDGKTLFTKHNCITCHGEDGKKPTAPIYPILAGKTQDFLLQQAKDIRDGKRTTGMSAVMKAMVANVKDEDFKEIAKYLAKIKPDK